MCAPLLNPSPSVAQFEPFQRAMWLHDTPSMAVKGPLTTSSPS
jgi:hypothetical protein